MEERPEEIGSIKQLLLNYLKEGRAYDSIGFTDAYFMNPANIRAFFEAFDIETLKIMAAEGAGSLNS